MAKVCLFNKPYGVVSQFSGDDNNLSHYINIKGVYPAGRLDKDSEGLLLLTDHGALQHRLSHPKFDKEKTYVVQVDGDITPEAIERLQTGVMLKDGPTKKAKARKIDEPEWLWPRTPPVRFRQHIPTSWIEIKLKEGRNRQVRRMTAEVGFPTLRLIRTQIDHYHLRGIEHGDYQCL